jgi:arylsulfatase A-like enzyme
MNKFHLSLKIATPLLLFLVLSGFAYSAESANSKPDIVIIIADDIGYSDFGCYGGEIPTPNIDRIAARGIRFTHYYSENMCAPSRAALLTGQYHIRGYNRGNNITIPEALSTAGYVSYAVGKWHNAGEKILDRHAPLKRGFDHFYGTPQGTSNFYAPITLTRDGEPAEKEWEENKNFYYTDAITENAVQYIKNTPKGKPLFLYTAYNAAHWPLHAPDKDIRKHKGKYSLGWDELRQQRMKRMKKLGIVPLEMPLSPRDSLVPSWEDEEHKAWQERRMEVYAAQIEIMDRGIGRIVEELEKSGRMNNTLLMVMVDNGGCHVEYEKERRGPFLSEFTRDGKKVKTGNIPGIMPGPEDTWQSYGRGWANASNTPFRLYKQYDHEGGIRVPLIIQWPSVIKEGGQITKQVGHVIDILPSVLEAASVEYPGAFNERTVKPPDGISLLPVFKGEERTSHEMLFFQFAQGAAAIKDNWKIVRKNNNPWELYDLATDPTEINNLAKQYPEKVTRLSLLWEKWKKQ